MEKASYDNIAAFYDSFTKEFDYSDYLRKCLEKLSKKPNGKLALDCGCGTGNLLEILEENGFDCTGVDISEEMLQKASEKMALKNTNFVCQNLSELDLYGAYDYVFCSLDTINHIVNKRELRSFFKRISNFIEPGGVFIFDIKTPEHIKSGAKTEFFEEENKTLIWEGILQKPYIFYRLIFFSPKEGKENGCFRKFETIIEERCYSREEIRSLMKKLSPLKYEKSFLYKKERTVFIYRKK